MLNINKHMDYFNPDNLKDSMVHIVGLGAIGSNLAMQLVRMGIRNFVLYDFDEVAEHNIPNQQYNQEDLGRTKLECITEKMLAVNPEILVLNVNQGWEPGTVLTDYVFLCLDSIELRHQIMLENKDNKMITFLCDMRIGLEEAQMYSANWKDNQAKDRIISTANFKDSEVTQPVNACGSFLNILPTIQMIVSLGSMNLVQFVNTKEYNYQSVTNSFLGITNSFK